MNQYLLNRYIQAYQENFSHIHNLEIYKWRAVKHFQDNWNIHSDNFGEMLSRSLSRTDNLMASGNYFPREVIVRNAIEFPKEVKASFVSLFDENINVLERIVNFQKKMKRISNKVFPDKKDFQDQRAIIVYLTLVDSSLKCNFYK